MSNWYESAIFYHIYPLGFCGCPGNNDNSTNVINRISKITDSVNYLKEIGVTALYLGPVFESISHGYDTSDFYKVDKRLGTNNDLKYLVQVFHDNGIKIVLDGVFNHVGRDFYAFKDLQKNDNNSIYNNWFYGVNFNKKSPEGDNFSYEGWNEHYSLVKLNLKNNEVKNYLFFAINMWINEFDIDGLRLDAADCVDIDFMKELRIFTKNIKNDFWLMGEIIHGDYNKWVNLDTLDSVTNYECYKGLYSSHNDLNYFEIAYSLKRQFGNDGIYKNLKLYNFVDNHDVNRLSSTLKNEKHLYPTYCLLFMIPGIPSIYYGSETGIKGKKENNSDSSLRPEIDLYLQNVKSEHKDLIDVIKKLIKIRKENDELIAGDYQEIYLDSATIIFSRTYKGKTIICCVSSNNLKKDYEINIKNFDNKNFIDILNSNETFQIINNKLKITLYPNWGRILKLI